MAGRRDKFDWTTLAIYLSLIITGWFMLYAVGYAELDQGQFQLDSSIGRQTIWIGFALFTFLLAQFIDIRFWRTFAYPIYTVAILLLIAVLLVGTEIKGARSWLVLGGFSFQPSEFAKFATLLALCTYLGYYEMRLRDPRSQLTALGLIAAPSFLILLQPDAGSAMVFAAFLILFFREGFPAGYFALGIYLIVCLIAGFIFPLQSVVLIITSGAGLILASTARPRIFALVLAGALLLVNVLHLLGFTLSMAWLIIINTGILAILVYLIWVMRQRQMILAVPMIILLGVAVTAISGYLYNDVLRPHQQDRINVWLQPDECDPQGALYNIIQSKVAIGSGGVVGKGFLDGSMTKLNFVPEQSTDFIFSTIGEEQGFLGSAAVILLYLALILRIIYLGEQSENKYIRHFGYGLGGMLFFHFFVNIGMTMGLVPVVGIPLPFISKGGTALLIFSFMIGVFLRMIKSRY